MGLAGRGTQLKSKKKTNVKQLHCPLICLFRLASVELSWSPVNMSDPVDTMILIPVLCAVGMGWVLHCHCEPLLSAWLAFPDTVKYQGVLKPQCSCSCTGPRPEAMQSPSSAPQAVGLGSLLGSALLPSAADRAVWDPHHTHLQQSNTQSRLRAQELCVALQPVGGNIRSHDAAQGGCWAFGLGPCFCCKNKVKNNGLTGWWLQVVTRITSQWHEVALWGALKNWQWWCCILISQHTMV